MKHLQVTIDVPEYLEKLGMENLKEYDQEVNFSCPFPDHQFGDRKPSAYMNKETTAWICFSCHRKGNAITLLADYMGVSLLQAKRWLDERWATNYYELKAEDMLSRWMTEFGMRLPSFVTDEANPIDDRDIDKYRVNWYRPSKLREYMIDERGFDPVILERFHVGYDHKSHRITFPFCNPAGDLVGFRGRLFEAERSAGGKYMPVGNPFKTSLELYEVHSVEPLNGNVLVIEGELNTLKARQYGLNHAVGIAGSILSKEHLRILLDIAGSVTLLFDSDEAGMVGNAKAQLLCEPHLTTYVVPKHTGDPASMTKDEVDHLINNKSLSILRYITGE